MSLRFSGVVIGLGFSLLFGACAKGGASGEPVVASQPSTGTAACGQDTSRVDYHGLQVGSLVRLLPHAELDGEANWAADMDYYVDLVTRVQVLAGVDFAGCPVVNVEADAEVFHWRVRDLEIVDAAPADSTRCGQSELFPDFLGISLASRVEIQRHRPWDGDENWVDSMDPYLGKRAVVTGLLGVDGAGCPGVSLDVDEGVHLWRVRDLKLLP